MLCDVLATCSTGTFSSARRLTLPAIVSPTLVATTIREEDRLRAAWLGEATERGILVRTLRWLGQASEVGETVAP